MSQIVELFKAKRAVDSHRSQLEKQIAAWEKEEREERAFEARQRKKAADKKAAVQANQDAWAAYRKEQEAEAEYNRWIARWPEWRRENLEARQQPPSDADVEAAHRKVVTSAFYKPGVAAVHQKDYPSGKVPPPRKIELTEPVFGGPADRDQALSALGSAVSKAMHDLPPLSGTIKFTLLDAWGDDLSERDRIGLSDPYMRLMPAAGDMPKKPQKSKTCLRTVDPEWPETHFSIDMDNRDSTSVFIELLDYDVVGKDDWLGRVEIDLQLCAAYCLALDRQRALNLDNDDEAKEAFRTASCIGPGLTLNFKWLDFGNTLDSDTLTEQCDGHFGFTIRFDDLGTTGDADAKPATCHMTKPLAPELYDAAHARHKAGETDLRIGEPADDAKKDDDDDDAAGGSAAAAAGTGKDEE